MTEATSSWEIDPASAADPSHGSGAKPGQTAIATTAAMKTARISGRRSARQSPSNISKKVRAKRADNDCCTRCGASMNIDDFRAKCGRCRRYGIVYDTYRRQFLTDFE